MTPVTQHRTVIHLQVLTYLALLEETELTELSYVSELPDSDCEAELEQVGARELVTQTHDVVAA